jgi:hypothetical protein
VIFGQDEARFDTPGNPFQIGLGMCVSTVMTAGKCSSLDRRGRAFRP